MIPCSARLSAKLDPCTCSHSFRQAFPDAHFVIIGSIACAGKCTEALLRLCRYGLASVLNVVIGSLEELFVEKCYDLITTAALRAMGGCKKLKVWKHIITLSLMVCCDPQACFFCAAFLGYHACRPELYICQ